MKDLTNNVYGKLTVLERALPLYNKKGYKIQRWLCRCLCGNLCIIRHGNLTSGTSTSCGCYKSKCTSERRLKDKTGCQYGQLTVVKKSRKSTNKKVYWLCKCLCGHYIDVCANNLTSGNTKSCGCMRYSVGLQKILKCLLQYDIKWLKLKKFFDLLSSKIDTVKI